MWNKYIKLRKLPHGWSNATRETGQPENQWVELWETSAKLEQTLNMLYCNILFHLYPIKLYLYLHIIWFRDSTSIVYFLHNWTKPRIYITCTPSKIHMSKYGCHQKSLDLSVKDLQYFRSIHTIKRIKEIKQ